MSTDIHPQTEPDADATTVVNETDVITPPKLTEEYELASMLALNAAEKRLKTKKKHGIKTIRDRFTFTETDYFKLLYLKKACLASGVRVKKAEILRAGLEALMQLNTAELNAAVGKVERIKTGKPVNASKKDK